ncbi:MAG: hypothetical protein WCX33_01830 [Candidatus Shapirobacteria bacterium]
MERVDNIQLGTRKEGELTVVEKTLWVLAIISFCLPWMWPLFFVIILNISDLIKRIRGKSIDDKIWLDDFNEKLDDFNEKIAYITVIWHYFTFPSLTCLSIYKTFTGTIMANKVIFFLLAMFFFCTEIYLLVRLSRFKKQHNNN